MKRNFFYNIYIDTSALRAMTKKTNRKYSKKYFTSSLTILEILTHFSRKNDQYSYNVMKSCFNFISLNKINIDWLMTEEKFKEALPLIKTKKIRTGNLKELFLIVVETNSIESFWDEIKKRNLNTDIQEAIDYDDFLGKSFNDPQKIKLFYSLISQAFNEGTIGNYFYKNEATVDNVKTFFKDLRSEKVEEGKMFLLYSLLRGRKPDNISNIFEGYKGQLELFLESFTKHQFLKAKGKNNYKKNDMIDIYHLLYVGSNSKILTNEKIIRNYVIEFRPDGIESIEKYLKNKP